MNGTFDPANLYLLGAIFLVLLACIWLAIESTELRQVNAVLAPSAAILCVVTMLIPVRSGQQIALIEAVYIPWATLGYSILFMLLLWLFNWLYQRIKRDSERYRAMTEEAEHGIQRPNTNQRLCRGDSRSTVIKR